VVDLTTCPERLRRHLPSFLLYQGLRSESLRRNTYNTSKPTVRQNLPRIVFFVLPLSDTSDRTRTPRWRLWTPAVKLFSLWDSLKSVSALPTLPARSESSQNLLCLKSQRKEVVKRVQRRGAGGRSHSGWAVVLYQNSVVLFGAIPEE